MCPRLLTVTCLLCVQVGLSAINILDKRSWGQKGVVLKYFDTGKYAARGGILRLWLRETGIPFSEETVPHDEWPALKAELKGTWENPTGELPMMTYQGKSFYGTNAIGRYLSRKVKARHFFTSYGQNAEDDFWVDVALEETHSMHNDWAKSLAGSNVRLFPRKTGFFGKVKRAVVGEGPGPAARRARIQYLKRDRKGRSI
uniref:GST N-terminal domain-containing protein n=1 Tax=Chromera velia CCMP2878 TaxID=1169474 RepID=A0A0G4FDH3_9ALVE|eukprot:Cvel_16323.t1-p1 / transcript=Cvel_16323.t1 / gene=Cvel_16323 / organism=Chromera_velia_CCMP2878 / gene_product=hypothetical protein / transcript_product=hypothetical protein / location=Cvel_scaffold1252:50404-51325(+) / protein_length=199 / sequence_SO=supercontig / SO=protein_coding / is_pseudo=false